MGWITFATAAIAEPVCKGIIAYKAKKYLSIIRILMYSIDVGSDAYVAYVFFYYFTGGTIVYGFPAGIVYGRITVASILLPIIFTAIALIFDIVTDPEKSILNKVLLVPIVLCCSLGLPLYHLVRDAIDSFQAQPTGNFEVASARSRLMEAFLEALPQVIIQATSIMIIAQLGDVEVWQILSLTSSLVTLTFTIASSTYLFKAKFTTRVIFFCCSLVAVTSRLLLGAGIFIPTASLLVAAITVWIIKRLCGKCCCLCCCRCVPLADVHYHCNPWSIIHVVITWVVTAACNCYTNTGLLMSSITLAWAMLEFMTMPPYLYGNPVLVIYFITCIAFASLTFLMNLVFVIVPKFRRSLGDRWLNIHKTTGAAQLY